MTYNEKKSLYESIISDIAKIVKRQINEAYNSRKIINFLNAMKDADKPIERSKEGTWGESCFAQSRFIAFSEPGNDIEKEGFSKYWPGMNFYKNVSEIEDSDCIGYFMTGKEAIKEGLFEPSNEKRYFLVFAPPIASISDNRRDLKFAKFDLEKIDGILQIKESAVKKIIDSDSKKSSNSQEEKERKEQYDRDMQSEKQWIAKYRSYIKQYISEKSTVSIYNSVIDITKKYKKYSKNGWEFSEYQQYKFIQELLYFIYRNIVELKSHNELEPSKIADDYIKSADFIKCMIKDANYISSVVCSETNSYHLIDEFTDKILMKIFDFKLS